MVTIQFLGLIAIWIAMTALGLMQVRPQTAAAPAVGIQDIRSVSGNVQAGVRYLAGPESSWVTGQSFAIEGGNELRKAPDMGALVEQVFGAEAFAAIKEGRAPLDE